MKEQDFVFIFSHDFAKAIWGNDEIFECEICKGIGNTDDMREKHCHKDFRAYHHRLLGEAWQYHLQQLVLEKEPLKYLEKFI